MSECVVRMKNPDDCLKCGVRHICNPYVDYWQQDTRKKPKPGQKGCLIICSIPEGHGRIIDADEFLKRAIGTKCFPEDYSRMLEQLVGESITIVPAERSET